jgi:hypothetical protein
MHSRLDAFMSTQPLPSRAGAALQARKAKKQPLI